jgi:drug/metabolite transporter (DMT)-like permease
LNKFFDPILFWFGFERTTAASLTPELEGEIPAPEDNVAKEQADGAFFMVAGAFFFSLMGLLVKTVGERIPIQEIVLVRAVFTFSLSYLALRQLGVPAWGQKSQRLLLVARGIVGFIALSGFYYSVVHMPLANATVVQYTNPIFAALFAVPVLRERITARDLLALLVSIFGVLLIAQPSFLIKGFEFDPNVLPVAIGLAGALGSGAAYVLVRKLSKSGEHPMVIVFYFALVSVVCSIPTSMTNIIWPAPLDWTILIGVGITTQLGQVSITRGLSRLKAARASAIGYLQIVFATIWGAIFFSQVPELATVIGAALIVGSNLVAAKKT